MNKLKIRIGQILFWSYKNDRRLYENIAEQFSHVGYRLDVMTDEGKLAREEASQPNFDIMDCLKLAISESDFHDTLRFQWTFSAGGVNVMHDYIYTLDTPNPYTTLLMPYIKERLQYLKSLNLADWHKSQDVDKHSHFRWWINHIIESGQSHQIKLLYSNGGVCRQVFNLDGQEDGGGAKEILSYILENFLCPDPHFKTIELYDPLQWNHSAPVVIKQSGNMGGFWYLVYLRGSELAEIYKKLNTRTMSYHHKAVWSFILKIAKYEHDSKFVLYVRKYMN